MSQPRIIGSRYELVRPIGEGGMGVVYAALDRLTGDEVALKQVTVAPKNLSFNTRSSPVSDLRMALAREFQTLASLRHPHIISVRDYGFDSEQRPFFTMTLLNQPVTLLQAADDLDDSGRLELILQVLQALEYLHRRGIIHRDLKPANVLVTQSGQVKVLDFGLAMQGDAPQEISGTLLYMPPEILQGKPATRASDLYAVGMMAHEMFAGKHPFRTENFSLLLADIMNTIPDPMTVPDMTEPESGVSWRGIVSRLLEKDPLDRYQSAGEVIRMVSRLLGVRTVPETTAIRDSYLQAAQFVGRSAEMGQLTAAIDALMDGRGSRWLIAGESGVGKSRFIEEVRTRALVEGATVLRGQEIAESRLSYHLWHDAVRRLLLTTDLDDLQLSILKEIIPDIAALKGRDIPDAPPLDGADARQRLGLAVLALFRQQKQPIVLIMEDLHWSSDSLDILRLLNRAADAQPLIIIGTYRDDEEFDVAEQLPTMQLLKLERLTERDVSQLAVSMLGEVGQRPEILSLLQRETEGNVYFLVETLRALAEEAGSLDDVARMDLPRHVLAGGVQQIIQRRLGQVPPEYVPLLRVASLIGRQLDLLLMWTVVQTLPEAEQVDVDTWLTVCANVPVFSNYDGRWRFAHDKLREGVLNEIEASARPDLHRLIARSIESAYPDDPEQARVLADHWHDAGDTDKALTYAITAVGVALARGNVTGAVQLLERALVTLDDQPDDPRRVTVLKLSGDAYEALSRYDEATTAYQESLTLAQARDDGAGVVSALNGLANVALKRGDLDTAQAQYDAVITRVADFAVSDQHADALNGLGTIAARRGQIEVARGYYDRSLALRRDINDQKGIAASLNNLGIIARYQGDLPRAIEYLNEALSLRRAIGDRRGVAATLSNLGITARQAGDYDTACEYYEQGVVITREIGDMHGVAAMLNNLGFARMAQKEHAAARTIFEEGLALVRRIGDRRGIAHALHNLGQLAVEQGDPSRAIDLLQESVTVAQEIDDPRGEGMARLDLARAQAQLGLIDQAFESAEAARAIYERIGDRAGQVQSGLVMVTLHVQSADFPTAENLLRPLFARFEPRPNDQLRDALMLLIQIWLPYKRWDEVARLTGFVLQNTADTSETARYLRSVRARLEFALGETETQAIITAGKQTTAEDILAFVRARPAIV